VRSLAVSIALIATVVASPPLHGQRRKECGEAKNPRHLPSPSDIVDSARVIALLAPYSRPSQAMLFSLVFFPDDSFPLVRSIDGGNGDDALILNRLAHAQQSSHPWAVRMRLMGGSSPALTIERSTYCPPQPTEGSVYPAEVVRYRDGTDRPVRMLGVGETTVELVVDETGAVVHERLLESSGVGDLDQAITRGWQRKRFLPGLVDGVPTRTIYWTDGKAPRL